MENSITLIKNNLIKENVKFNSSGDTEVFFKLYEKKV